MILQDSTLKSRTGEVYLFSSFSSFEKLASALPNIPNASQKTILLSSTIRALESVSRVLRNVLTRSPPSSTSGAFCSHGETLQTLNVLTTHLLSVSFSLLFPDVSSAKPSTEQRKPAKKAKKEEKSAPSNSTSSGTYSLEFRSSFEKLLDTLTTLVLRPIIQAFASLSETYLLSVFDAPATAAPKDRSSSKPSPDIRPDILSLFRSTFFLVSQLVVCFDTPSDGQVFSNSYVLGVREFLSLAAVRELLKLFECRESISDDPRTHSLMDFMASTTLGDRHNGEGMNSTTTKESTFTDATSKRTPAGITPRRNNRNDRIRKLARKDAVWYLCTILHVLFENAYFPSETTESAVFPTATDLGPIASLPSSKTNPRNSSLEPTPSNVSSLGGYPSPAGSHKESIVGNHPENPLTSDRHMDVSETEANASSLSLLRAGLLDSFDALLVLVTKCRPSDSPPSSWSAVPKRSDIDIGNRVSARDERVGTADVENSGNQGNIPTVVNTRSHMDELEYELVLGVVERYWECTLGVEHQGGK